MINPKLYNDLLNKKYPDVIVDFDKDDEDGIMEVEDWKGLLKHEEENNKRMQLIDYFKIKIKHFKKPKEEPKKMSEDIKQSGINIVLTPEAPRAGITIEKFHVTLSKKRPVKVSKEVADYVKKAYDKKNTNGVEWFKILSDAEIKKIDEKKAKIEAKTKENN